VKSHGTISRTSLAIFFMAAASTLIAPASARAQDSWTTSQASCANTPDDPAKGQYLNDVTAEGGEIESQTVYEGQDLPLSCTWSGFPNVVITSPAVLSFEANLTSDSVGAELHGYSIFYVGLAGSTAPIGEEDAPYPAKNPDYPGTYQVVLPAGTNLSNVFVNVSVYAGPGAGGGLGTKYYLSTASVGDFLIELQ